MNVAPVIERELRVEARSRISFWLRTLSAGGAIIVMALVTPPDNTITQSALGRLLFNSVNRCLLAGILIVAPLLTADCISKERREGTLGLLFLTPLGARDVVWAKVVVQVLRGLLVIGAALPMLAVPFLLGGVSIEMGVQAALVQFSALMLGMAAGLYASTRHVEWMQSVVKAELLNILAVLAVRGFLIDGFDGKWEFALPGFIGALVVFYGVVVMAATEVRNRVNQEGANERSSAVVRLLAGSEFWQRVFRWDKRPTLDRNPIAWLQEYSWTARLTKWGWVVAILVMVVAASILDENEFFIGQKNLNLLTLALAAGMAFAATASFRRELESGVLELLLVSPLTPAQIVYGRIWGVFCHFLPAIAILGLYWLFALGFDINYHPNSYNALPALVFAPPVGLAASFLRANFIVTWLIACAVTGVLAAVFAAIFGSVFIGAVAVVWFYTRILDTVIQKLTRRSFELAGA